jgi:hypothetical protein
VRRLELVVLVQVRRTARRAAGSLSELVVTYDAEVLGMAGLQRNPGRRKETEVAFRQRAQIFFATNGITVKQVVTDSLATDALRVAITHRHIQPGVDLSQ